MLSPGMAPCRKHQKAEKQDTDGLPHYNDAMTSAPNLVVIPLLCMSIVVAQW